MLQYIAYMCCVFGVFFLVSYVIYVFALSLHNKKGNYHLDLFQTELNFFKI